MYRAHRAHGSFIAALGALALGLAVPAGASAQEVEEEADAAVTSTEQELQKEAQEQQEQEMSQNADDLVTVARSAGNLGSFLTIVEEAGLTSELSTGGPYTIFAPTDEAFAAAEAGAYASDDAAELQRLVRTHIAVGEWTSSELAGADGITNLLADDLALQWTPAEASPERAPQVEQAAVVKSDLAASNGVIHEIDAVLSPSPTPVSAGHTGNGDPGMEEAQPASGTASSPPESAAPDGPDAGAGR